MATYEFYIYNTGALAYNPGTGAFDFDAGYNHVDGRYLVVVDDDDTTFNSSGDGNQTATVYDTAGNVIASGLITTPQYGILSSPGGDIYIDRIEVGGFHVGYASDTLMTPGESYPYTGGGTWSGAYSYYESVSIPCFTNGVLIETDRGERPVEDLRAGDRVRTLDNGYQPILWCAFSPVTGIRAALARKLRPVTLRPGCLGPGWPDRPIRVSRDHRLLLDDYRVDLLFGTGEVFAPARAIALPERFAAEGFRYIHILLPRHEVVRANGIWTESFFPGGEAMKRLSSVQCRQVRDCLGPGWNRLRTARRCLTLREARTYAALGATQREPAPRGMRRIRVAGLRGLA